jgi:hypothetical protein
LLSNLRRAALVLATSLGLGSLCLSTAQAIPIFAERYQLKCEACHSVLPELNAFGRAFRAHGYRLPGAKKHGSIPVALRYQLQYEAQPVNSRVFSPGGVLLGNQDVGNITAFVHYNLGAGGGPAGTFLAYLATYDTHTKTLWRAGLFELPLAQSPGQRLDDLQQYGYYGSHVGLNDLTLASPRWGVQAERTLGPTVFDAVADLGEFKGAAYGGVPVPTGDITSAAAPELGLFVHSQVLPHFVIGGEALEGTRSIVLTGKNPFDDSYDRNGLYATLTEGPFELQGEQWYGRDHDADGLGTAISSTGGYLRFKYYATPHAYFGVRYDAAANPIITRDVTYYGAFMILPDTRFELEQVQNIHGTGNFGGALTLGLPGPPNV